MSDSRPIEDLSYEQAFDELEEIVRVLDSGEQDLESSLALFERGQALAGRCSQLLEAAEVKMNQLVEAEDGDVAEQPVDGAGS
jgi:exodeoxyribonuclease VII small subunit